MGTETQGVELTISDEDVACQSAHLHPGNRTCSVEVTHAVMSRCVGTEVLVCQNHVTSLVKRIEEGVICRPCRRLAVRCWTFRPV